MTEQPSSNLDALLLLKSSMSTPKLTHLLRAAPCAGHSALAALDKILHSSISVLLTVTFRRPVGSS